MVKSAVQAEAMARPCDPSLGYLILTNESPANWLAVVEHRRQVIGRSRHCDISLPGHFAHVSRRHAEVFTDRCGIWIRDLDSRSGTRVNGIWIEKNQQASLVYGDRIWLGGAEIKLVAEIPAPAQLMSESDISGDETGGGSGGVMARPAQVMFAELSQAELAIVLWMGRGYLKDEDIAAKLFRSPNTVRTQVNSIFRKLNVRSRADIISLLRG